MRGLTKRFGSLAVVDQISLRIDHGQLVCLLGPSGCGKTTTLRLIAGFLEPSEGEIHVGDRLVSSKSKTLPPEQRKMSMIFQSYALWPHMTVAENIDCGPLHGEFIRRQAEARSPGPRADRRAGNAAARRAAVQPRCQSAGGDAL